MEDIKGLDLCRGFFFDAVKPVLDQHFPRLCYTAGLIGYGSDVLGYDDAVSRDHMWGPRCYLFLRDEELPQKAKLLAVLGEELPYEYHGYSVNFTEPDPNDNGVRHPKRISSGTVNPLIFIESVDSFLQEQLGTCKLDELSAADWLSFSEHRLLSLTAGELFVDGLGMGERLGRLRFYPDIVRNYLLASSWDAIASEQAFVRRCADVGDDMGSTILCARICERLMRLCFLYQGKYAPYSKWFGTAFRRLNVGEELNTALHGALHAVSAEKREQYLVQAQALVAELHNASGITVPVDYEIEDYYGRKIKVIFADKFAEAMAETLQGTELEGVPLLGSFSQMGGLSNVSDDLQHRERISYFYKED